MGMVVVVSTFADMDSARRVSASAVQDRMAACASMVPVRSIYEWEGSLEDSAEYMVIFKTTSQKAGALSEYLSEHHPYDTPEIASIRVQDVNGPYMRWLSEMTA